MPGLVWPQTPAPVLSFYLLIPDGAVFPPLTSAETVSFLVFLQASLLSWSTPFSEILLCLESSTSLPTLQPGPLPYVVHTNNVRANLEPWLPLPPSLPSLLHSICFLSFSLFFLQETLVGLSVGPSMCWTQRAMVECCPCSACGSAGNEATSSQM